VATDPQEKLRRLLVGSIPFPARGHVWLVDTGLEFLAREALDALGSERLSVVERDLVTARRLAAALPTLSVAHAPRALAEAGDFVVLPLDKDRRALFGALAALATRVGPAGSLALYGARREGIEPALRYLADFCTLAPPLARAGLRLALAQPMAGRAAAPLDLPESYVAEARGCRVPVACRPGVFSWRGLDAATALMLERCVPRTGDRLLDLGCGAGVVAALLLEEGRVTQATLVDSDALALEAAAATLALNGLSAPVARVQASDAGSELEADSFDLILCNPPLHRGFAAERDAPGRMIDESVRLLAPHGRLLIVGPPALRLGARLAVRFQETERLSGDIALELWRASRPRRTPLSPDARRES
jgi:16S rRNA (guanine1207-N2)-methyltransferase